MSNTRYLNLKNISEKNTALSYGLVNAFDSQVFLGKNDTLCSKIIDAIQENNKHQEVSLDSLEWLSKAKCKNSLEKKPKLCSEIINALQKNNTHQNLSLETSEWLSTVKCQDSLKEKTEFDIFPELSHENKHNDKHQSSSSSLTKFLLNKQRKNKYPGLSSEFNSFLEESHLNQKKDKYSGFSSEFDFFSGGFHPNQSNYKYPGLSSEINSFSRGFHPDQSNYKYPGFSSEINSFSRGFHLNQNKNKYPGFSSGFNSFSGGFNPNRDKDKYQDCAYHFDTLFYANQYDGEQRSNIIISTPSLSWSVGTPDGRAFLEKNASLRSRITIENLNAIQREDESEDNAVLYWLANTPEGPFLLEDAALRSRITAEGLNTIQKAYRHEGTSVLYWLASTAQGQKLLSEDSELYNKITVEGLNAVALVDYDKNKSAIINDIDTPPFLTNLKNNTTLINLMVVGYLNIESTKKLADILKNNITLRKLHLILKMNTADEKEICSILLDAFNKNTTLTHITFRSFNKIVSNKINLQYLEYPNDTDIPDPYKRIIIYCLVRNRILNAINIINLSHFHLHFLSLDDKQKLLLLIPEKEYFKLNMSHNGLNNKDCESIAELLHLNKKIKKIDLSHNYITYTGVKNLISDNLRTNTFLKKINLKSNFITCVESLFIKLENHVLKNAPALEKVSIDQNFLDTDCHKYFSLCEEKKIQDNSLPTTPLYQHGIFRTKAKPVISLLNEKYIITVKDWVVALVCRKGTEHAFLYMEGMSEWGQRFFKRYHISPSHTVGSAYILIEDIYPQLYHPNNYDMIPIKITHTDGTTLQDFITAESERNTPIGFSKISPGCSRGKVNCLSWCLKMLKLIDIEIEPSLLSLPSRTVKQHWF